MPQPSVGAIWMDSPTARAGATKWNTLTGTYQSAQTPYGGDSIRTQDTIGTFALKNFSPGITTISASCLFRYNTNTAHNQGDGLMVLQGGGVSHLSIRPQSDGSMRLYRGGIVGGATEIATSAPSKVFASGWYHVELLATIDDSSGLAKVFLDGAEIINFSGDTRNGGTSAAITGVKWGHMNNGSLDMADFVIAESTTQVGVTRVIPLLPNGAGATTGLSQSPGSGSNFDKVDEQVPDSDTTYVFSATEGDLDLYDLANLPGGTWDVLAIQTVNHARRTDAGTKFWRPIIRTGGSNFVGASVAAPETYQAGMQIWDDNPDTTAQWDQTEIDALQAGIEVRDS